ncbi:MAG: HlyD family efflux transporter periplasmic adaptor subunit [Betaproteobacteria bacterium]|nr:MAG: HlyD family efflux transporter periplasmic adaptor subunit [Betaproteobacteria bacterium]
MLADGSVGSADHERQKARADAAAARLEQARRQLDLARNREGYTTLVAPYAGVVTALRFERGQVVAEGQPVLSLARDGEREIVADLPRNGWARCAPSPPRPRPGTTRSPRCGWCCANFLRSPARRAGPSACATPRPRNRARRSPPCPWAAPCS